jgi:multisubunit Na+/H+ antiporter MnhF subunit
VSAWILASIVLVCALGACVVGCLVRTILDALIALELGGTIATVTFIVLAEGVHRQPFVDLALVLAVLTFVGSLAFARLLERRV